MGQGHWKPSISTFSCPVPTFQIISKRDQPASLLILLLEFLGQYVNNAPYRVFQSFFCYRTRSVSEPFPFSFVYLLFNGPLMALSPYINHCYRYSACPYIWGKVSILLKAELRNIWIYVSIFFCYISGSQTLSHDRFYIRKEVQFCS